MAVSNTRIRLIFFIFGRVPIYSWGRRSSCGTILDVTASATLHSHTFFYGIVDPKERWRKYILVLSAPTSIPPQSVALELRPMRLIQRLPRWSHWVKGCGPYLAIFFLCPSMQFLSRSISHFELKTKQTRITRGENELKVIKICRDPGSTRGPLDLQSNALPTELPRLLSDSVGAVAVAVAVASG